MILLCCKQEVKNILQNQHIYMASACIHVQLLSFVQLFETSWTVAHHSPLSMKFSRHEYWGELPFPSPGDLPNPGVKPASPAWLVDSLPLNHLWCSIHGKIWVQNKIKKPTMYLSIYVITYTNDQKYLFSLSIYQSPFSVICI